MRKLMWFALGFSAVCALCAYLWITEALWVYAMVSAAACVGFLFLSRRVRLLRFFAAVSAGFAAAFLWFSCYATNYLAPVSRLDGETTFTVARCTDYSYGTDFGAAVETVINLDGKYVRAKLYLDKPEQLQPGDLIRGSFRFRVTTPDGADEPTAHRGKGIFLLAYQSSDVQHRIPQTRPDWTIPARLRHHLLNILDTAFPQDAAPFAKALLLGERSSIDYETNTAFKLSGISHVIAVSGLHVTILFALINLLCMKRRWLVAVLGIPVLLLFAAVAGFSPSITRACLMQCLMMVAMLLNREYDGPTELAFSCLVMLVVNPLVITSVSFQLSVVCMIGIYLFQGRLQTYFTSRFAGKGKTLPKLRHWIIASVSVTLSAMVVTTPLVAIYFGAVSLVGVLANLLTLWVISFIFYGIILVCVLSTFWTAASSAVAALIAWPIRYVLFTAKVLASFPLAAVYTTSIYIVIWLVFCYALLAVFFFDKERKPLLFICCAAIGLCVALGASILEPLTDQCRMTVLDVGQGQCILLQSEGKFYLVDCGGSNGEEAADAAAEHLLSQGITYLDGVILTHFDADHAGGMEHLMSRIPAKILIVPSCPDENGILPRLAAHTDQVLQLKDNVKLTFENTEISIFGPVVPNSDNESNLAILFSHKEYDILITGDRNGFGERVLLKTAQLPELDVLVAGHHGSKTSTCEELLHATKPEIAVISVGENSFGHPSQEVLDRLAAIGCVVYRTDLHGNIILRS